MPEPNMALWDRSLRFALGVLLLTWAVAGGPIWAYLGVLSLGTASWGLCPLYSIFKFSTRQDGLE